MPSHQYDQKPRGGSWYDSTRLNCGNEHKFQQRRNQAGRYGFTGRHRPWKRNQQAG